MKGNAGFIFLAGMVFGMVISSISAHYGVFSACHW